MERKEKIEVDRMMENFQECEEKDEIMIRKR
jgi:hypothetical protein